MFITKEQVEALVTKEQFHRFPDTTVTVCCLTLQNGFTVTGESACVDPDEFNEAAGKKYAREQAIDKVYSHEAYMFKQKTFCFGNR